MKKKRVFIGVGGRFHADRLAHAILAQGDQLRLFTSYPRSSFKSVPPDCIHSFLPSEIVYRALKKIGRERNGEHAKMLSFAKYLARSANKFPSDDYFVWSSWAKELFGQVRYGRKILLRDSTHIAHQMEVLEEENRKLGIRFSMDKLCIDREMAEYELADRIIVLSAYAQKTFTDRGIPASKIKVMHLGVDRSVFEYSERRAFPRPLRALYFGTLSVRKGTQYLLAATENFSPEELKLTLVGPVEDDFKSILRRYPHATHLGPLPHAPINQLCQVNDIYVFPTLEDGFPNSLIQAMVTGLVPLATPNNGPAEWITDGRDGFLVPAADTNSLREKISRLVANPSLLGPMREKASQLVRPLSWATYAESMQRLIKSNFTINPGLELGAQRPRASAEETHVNCPVEPATVLDPRA